MGGVITGFAVIAGVIATGYVIGRRDALGAGGREVLTRLSFHVATPALLFVTLAEADLTVIFSLPLLVTALSTVIVAGMFTTVGLLRRWGTGRTTVGALASSYVNAGNLGIPIAVYVLGDPSLVAPVMLFQQMLITPIALTVLDLAGEDGEEGGEGEERRGGVPVWRRLTAPFRNPVVVGSLGGVAAAASGRTVPGILLEPVTLIGNMAVPAVLLAFGISLCGETLPGRGAERAPVLLSVFLKCVVHPLVAWSLAAGVFGLGAEECFHIVVLAALPAAQNLFTYASRYGTAVRLAREAVLLTTMASVPALTAVAALLGG